MPQFGQHPSSDALAGFTLAPFVGFGWTPDNPWERLGGLWNTPEGTIILVKKLLINRPSSRYVIYSFSVHRLTHAHLPARLWRSLWPFTSPCLHLLEP